MELDRQQRDGIVMATAVATIRPKTRPIPTNDADHDTERYLSSDSQDAGEDDDDFFRDIIAATDNVTTDNDQRPEPEPDTESDHDDDTNAWVDVE